MNGVFSKKMPLLLLYIPHDVSAGERENGLAKQVYVPRFPFLLSRKYTPSCPKYMPTVGAVEL